MKLYTILFLSLFSLMACENTDETAAAEAAASATCTITNDNTVRKLDSACFSGSEFEHLRFTGLTIPNGSVINIWVKTNASQATGSKLTFTGGAANTTIAWDDLSNGAGNETNLDNNQNTGAAVSNSTLCADLHFEENPIHLVVWFGASCDASYDGGAALTASNPRTNNSTNGGNATADTGDVYYQIPATVTVGSFTAKGAIAENI